MVGRFMDVNYFHLFNRLKRSKKRGLSDVVGSPSYFGEGCRFKGVDFSGIVEIGKYVSIWGPNIKITGRLFPVKIGSFSSIALNTIVITYNHRFDRASSYFILKNIFNESLQEDIESKGPILIEEDVWIGANSVILGGVTIGRGSIIAAGSVVTRSIPAYSIVAGNPAVVVRSRFSKETIDMLENSKWWDWDIEEIKKNREFFTKRLH